VTAAVKWAEALVALRLATAKRGDYARPLPKRYDGEFARFSPVEDASATAPDAATARSGTAEPDRMPNLPHPHIHTV